MTEQNAVLRVELPSPPREGRTRASMDVMTEEDYTKPCAIMSTSGGIDDLGFACQQFDCPNIANKRSLMGLAYVQTFA